MKKKQKFEKMKNFEKITSYNGFSDWSKLKSYLKRVIEGGKLAKNHKKLPLYPGRHEHRYEPTVLVHVDIW